MGISHSSGIEHRFASSGSWAQLPSKPRLCPLVIAGVVDLYLATGQHFDPRQESNRAVEPYGVAVVRVLPNQLPLRSGRTPW